MFCLLIPLGGLPGLPDNSLPGVPVGPAHPIVLPPLPPGVELPPGLGGTPEHPIYYPPVAGQGPGLPSNPIAPGGQPPGIWGGPPLYPDQGLPGRPPVPGWPSHPIILPGTPEHPIAGEPGQVWPPLVGVQTAAIALAWLPGYGWRWVRVDPTVNPTEST
jgi:hypothetical protein